MSTIINLMPTQEVFSFTSFIAPKLGASGFAVDYHKLVASEKEQKYYRVLAFHNKGRDVEYLAEAPWEQKEFKSLEEAKEFVISEYQKKANACR